MSVVSLPDAFVFRVNLQDPHPFPWIRVKLSCAIGHALYPHSQWERSARLWEEFYARDRLDQERARLITQLEAHLPVFVSFLTNHRLAALRGRALPDVLSLEQRQPNHLMSLWQQWQTNPAGLRGAQPTLAFAVIGQAKADDAIEPEAETDLIGKLLNHWALRSTLDASALCAEAARRPAKALVA
jgi:hypothetical protein